MEAFTHVARQTHHHRDDRVGTMKKWCMCNSNQIVFASRKPSHGTVFIKMIFCAFATCLTYIRITGT